MSTKATLASIKKTIRETKLETKYHEKFVENFSDVRKHTLSEEQLDLLAEILFEEVMKK